MMIFIATFAELSSLHFAVCLYLYISCKLLCKFTYLTNEAEYCGGFLSLSHCVHLLNRDIEFYHNHVKKKNISSLYGYLMSGSI